MELQESKISENKRLTPERTQKCRTEERTRVTRKCGEAASGQQQQDEDGVST